MSTACPTIMFSSHILSEVQNLCDKVVIINKGKIIAKDTVENLNKYLKIRPRLEITIPGLNGKIPEIIKKIDGIESIDIKNDVLFITCDSVARFNIISELKNKGFDVKDIRGTPDQGITDEKLWQIAQKEKRLLITTDKGFSGLIFLFVRLEHRS